MILESRSTRDSTNKRRRTQADVIVCPESSPDS